MELGVHNPVRVKSTQDEGIIKMVEYLGNKPEFFYIELNSAFKSKDVRRFRTSHQGDWNLLRVPAEDVEYREPAGSKDIYKLIVEKDLEAIKGLKARSFFKKPTNNEQRDWGNVLNWAIVKGSADIVCWLLTFGLKFEEIRGGMSSTTPKTIYDVLLCSSTIRTFDELEKCWDLMELKGNPVKLSQEARIWGTMGYHGRWNDPEGQIAKTDLINKKTDFFTSKDAGIIKNRDEVLQAAMYNGYTEWSKHMIGLGANPHEATKLMLNNIDYCEKTLKSKGSSLEEMYKLYYEKFKK